MRRSAFVTSVSLVAFLGACNMPKKSKSDSSSDPQQDPGNVNIDTKPDEEEVDDSKKVTDNPVDPGVEKVQMTGSLAISGTGLTSTGKPDKVLAFPIQGGELKSIGEVIKADVDADGKFSLALPKLSDADALLQSCLKDGKVDREKLKQYVLATGQDPNEILNESDENLVKSVTEEIEKLKNRPVTWVVVSMVSSTKTEGLEKRAEEAATFAFIGLSAGGGNLFNIPVADAKKDLDLGKIVIEGDDAKSDVNAAEGDRFGLSGTTLSQLAATGATLKAIKNDYVNIDPKTGEYFHSSPFFAFEGDVEDLGTDSFTKLDLAYALSVKLASNIGYSGYGLYMRGRHKDPSHPTVDLMTKNLCADDPRKIELVPPLGAIINTTTSEVFNPSRPMSKVHASAAESINGGTRYQCGSSTYDQANAQDEFYYASGQALNDKELNWNWGSGGSLLGNVPGGIWELEVEDSHLASFDLAAAQPLSPISNLDSVANVFVPQIKVTKDNGGFITKVDVKFNYYVEGAFQPVTDLVAIRRGVEELAVEFDDYSGTREGNRILLSEAPVEGGVFSADPATGETPAPMLFPTGSNADSQRVADAISVTYKMYGNTYRFDFRIR